MHARRVPPASLAAASAVLLVACAAAVVAAPVAAASAVPAEGGGLPDAWHALAVLFTPPPPPPIHGAIYLGADPVNIHQAYAHEPPDVTPTQLPTLNHLAPPSILPQASLLPSNAPPPAQSWHIFSEVQAPPAGPAHSPGSYESGIISVNPAFFYGSGIAPHDSRHRYLIFGAGSPSPLPGDTVPSLPGSSAPAVPTPTPQQQLPGAGGFFSTATLSGDRAADLASQGFIVIRDRPLDLHDSQSGHPEPLLGRPADAPGHYGAMALHGAAEAAEAAAVHNSDGRAAGSSPDGGQGTPGTQPSPGAQALGDTSRIRLVAGLGPDITRQYNATGDGITIAVVDTGVDFSNPDMQHSLARDAVTNHPIMLDPDGQGIVITNGTFHAAIDERGVVKNHTKKQPPDGIDSVVYVTGEGVFLDVKRGGRGMDIPVYNSLYPHIGTAPVFNGTLESDMRIGKNAHDYIRSQSGTYRLGVIFQMAPAGLGPQDSPKIQVVPVLVVDSAVPGSYDTIIPDMSTSWKDYVKDPQKEPDYDFDFTDETPIILGSGNEFLTYDSDGDGMADYTAGTVGARVLDVYSVTNASLAAHYNEQINAVNGTLLPGMDPGGMFFGVMTDNHGHGTTSSATIASAGVMEYDIYNDTGRHTITGVAPGAKILPVKALWLGDAVYGWLWAAGFENRGSQWVFSGDTRSDIISNSWGVSTFPSVGFAPGYDMLSLVYDMLAVPRSFDDDYPGVVMISSAGNSGHGYGTLGMPGAASLGVSVGASTNNVFVGYGPFKDQPRFGSNASHHGDMVDFSSRGPGAVGDVRPDVVSMGAYGFVPRNVMGAVQDSGIQDPFRLFGGTSMAGPMVAGVAAVVMEAMNQNLLDYDPFVVRNILMSTARDTHNDPFVQGSGLANAGAALDFVHGRDGVFAVSNYDSYRNIRDVLYGAIEHANITDTGIGRFELPERPMPMTSWFAGHLHPGDRITTTFTVENPGAEPLALKVLPQVVSLAERTSYGGTTVLRQQDPVLNDTGAYAPNYVRLADIHRDDSLADLFDDGRPARGTSLLPDGTSLLILDVRFAFDDFMNMSSDVYADDMRIASLYLYDWVDKNGDSEVASDELSLVTRGGSWGTVQEVRVSDPASRFDGVPLVGIYPVLQKYSYWTGVNGANATALDYVVSASYYKKAAWDSVWPGRSAVDVGAAGAAEVDVTLIIPEDADAGIYHGFVAFEGADHTVNVPTSFVVSAPIREANTSVSLVSGPDGQRNATLGANGATGPGPSDAPAAAAAADMTYGNGYTKGAFDMADRYMSGDWRHYHFEVQDSSITAASVELSWASPRTSISAFVIDPTGRIVQTNVPSGIFGHIMDWPSVDWLGYTPFSEGGGFYPVSGGPDGGANHTFMTVPISGTGTYAIMTHATLFGAEDSSTERVGVTVHFYDDLSAPVTAPRPQSLTAGAPDLGHGEFSGGPGGPSFMEPHGLAATGNAAPGAGVTHGSDGVMYGVQAGDAGGGHASDGGPGHAGPGSYESEAGGGSAQAAAPNAPGMRDAEGGNGLAASGDVGDERAGHADPPPLPPSSDDGFTIGVVMGLAAGVATCVAFFVILRGSRGKNLAPVQRHASYGP